MLQRWGFRFAPNAQFPPPKASHSLALAHHVRAYREVAGKVEQTVQVSPYVPIDQRDFHPEAWDSDEHARFAELSAIPVHALTRDQFEEIQELKRRAKVLILNADQPATELKPLPPPSDRSPQVPDEIDRREEDEDDE